MTPVHDCQSCKHFRKAFWLDPDHQNRPVEYELVGDCNVPLPLSVERKRVGKADTACTFWMRKP